MDLVAALEEEADLLRLFGEQAAVPTLDARGLAALALILAAISILMIRRTTS